jgi:hypothetical protein
MLLCHTQRVRPEIDMKTSLFAGVALVALVAGSAAAQAFTMNTLANSDTGGSSAVVDPDDKVQEFANGRTSTEQQGSPRFHFDVRPYGSGATNGFSSPFGFGDATNNRFSSPLGIRGFPGER